LKGSVIEESENSNDKKKENEKFAEFLEKKRFCGEKRNENCENMN